MRRLIMWNKIKNILTVEVPFWVFAITFFMFVIVVNIDTSEPVEPCNAVGMKLTGPDGETILEFTIENDD